MSDRYIPTDTIPMTVEQQLSSLIERRAPGSVIYSRALDEIIRLRAEIERLTRERDIAETNYERGRAEALEEAAAWFEGNGGVIPGASVFARLVSRNNQPCMSGDPRDRLNRFDRRDFDEAMAYVAERIRALKDKPANQTDGGE